MVLDSELSQEAPQHASAVFGAPSSSVAASTTAACAATATAVTTGSACSSAAAMACCRAEAARSTCSRRLPLVPQRCAAARAWS